MLSDKDKQAILNGANGVTSEGAKAIFLCEDGLDIEFPYLVAVIPKDIRRAEALWFSKDFTCGGGDAGINVVGLWKDKPEPFNLERALAGEPIFNNNFGSGKAYLSKSSFDDETFIVEYENEVGLYGTSQLNIDFKMWKEPEPVKPNADDLPKPIKDFRDLTEVWYVGSNVNFNGYTPIYSIKGNSWSKWQKRQIKKGVYYATKEDCQAVCDWLMNR